MVENNKKAIEFIGLRVLRVLRGKIFLACASSASDPASCPRAEPFGHELRAEWRPGHLRAALSRLPIGVKLSSRFCLTNRDGHSSLFTTRCAGGTEARSWRSISVPSSGEPLRGFATVCGQVAKDESNRQLPHTVVNPRNTGVEWIPRMNRTIRLLCARISVPPCLQRSGWCNLTLNTYARLSRPSLQHSSFLVRYSAVLSLLSLFTLAFITTISFASPPAWWISRSVVNTNASTANDFAAANLGQLKWFATNALAEFEVSFSATGGAGDPLRSRVYALCAATGSDYRAINLGTLKYTVAPFYDRLGTNYPWSGVAAQDFAIANLGQLKWAFDFSSPDNTPPQFSLNLSASGAPAYFNLPAVSYYSSNTQVEIQASTYGPYDYFLDWKDARTGAKTNVNPLTVTMNTNRSFIAECSSMLNGLMVYYSFNKNFGGVGTIIPDESGHNITASNVNSVWSPTGKIGGALSAYGPANSIGSTADLNYRTINTTFCAWVKLDPSVPRTFMELITANSTYESDKILSVYSDVYISAAIPYPSSYSSGQRLTPNVWYFVAITSSQNYNNNYRTLFVNGQAVETSTHGFWSGALGGKLRISGIAHVDEFMVFNRILATNEIMQLYNQTLPNYVSLVASNGPTATNQPKGTYLEVIEGATTNWCMYLSNNVPFMVRNHSEIHLSVPPDVVINNGTERDVCLGYTGSGQISNGTTSVIVITNLTQSSTVSWLWQTNYWANLLSSGGCGHLSSDAGWYPKGTVITNLTAIPDGAGNFIQWTAGVEPARRLINPINVSIKSPTNITAQFSSTQGWLVVKSLYGSPNPVCGTNIVNYGMNTTNIVMYDTRSTTQYACIGWTGSGSVPATGSTNSATFNMASSPSTITWRWATNYLVTTGVTPSSYGSVSNNLGWYRLGATATVTAVQTSNSLFRTWTGTGISLAGISNNNPLTFVVTKPVSLTANFDTSGPLTVQTKHGTPSPYPPGISTVNYGTIINASISSPVISGGTTQYISKGWTGTGSVPASGSSNSVSFTFSVPSSINWSKWATNYLISVSSWYFASDRTPLPGGGNVSNNRSEVTEAAGWWYGLSSNLALTATPAPGCIFQYWTGSVFSVNTNIPLFAVTKPVVLTAVFARDSDADSIPDWWENRYGLNPYDPSDAYESLNFNGTNNLASYQQLGTNFLVVATPTNALPPSLDTDGDGISDYYEWLFFGTGKFGRDSDGDGLCDGDEIFIYGTNPNQLSTFGNGISDGWAVANGLDPLNPANSTNLCDFASFRSGAGVTTGPTNGWNNLLQYCSSMDTDGDGLVDAPPVASHVVPLGEYRACWLPTSYNFAFADPTLSGYCQNEVSLTNTFRVDSNGDGFSDAMELFAGRNAATSNSVAQFTNDYAVLSVSVAPASVGKWGVHMWAPNNIVFAASAGATSGSGYACVPRTVAPTNIFFSLAYTNPAQRGTSYAVDFRLAPGGGPFDWVINPAASDAVSSNYPTATNVVVRWGFTRPLFSMPTTPITLNANTTSGLTNVTPITITLSPANSPNGFLTLSAETNGNGRIKLYSAAACTPAQEITPLPRTWACTNAIPTNLWLRGTVASSSSNDVTLVATYSNALLSAVLTNRLPITVVDASVLWAHKYALANSTISDGIAQVCVQVTPTNHPVSLSVGSDTFNTADPAQFAPLGNGIYMASVSNKPVNMYPIRLLGFPVTNPPVAFVGITYLSVNNWSGFASQSFSAVFNPAQKSATLQPLDINGAGTCTLSVYGQSIPRTNNANPNWSFTINDTFANIVASGLNWYSASWQLPLDRGRQVIANSAVQAPLVSVTPDESDGLDIDDPNSSSYHTYHIIFTHSNSLTQASHGHDSQYGGVCFSSVSYSNSTFELIYPSDSLVSNISWEVSSNSFGSFANNNLGNPVSYLWTYASNASGTIVANYYRTNSAKFRQMSFEIVNNLLTLTPARTIIPTNAPAQFLAFPPPALPADTLVDLSVDPWYDNEYSGTTTGILFQAEETAANKYVITATPNWCSTAYGCATVYVCNVSLSAAAGITHAANTMPGAIVLRSASTSDCSRLKSLTLNLQPATLPVGTLTLSLSGAQNNYKVWDNATKAGSPMSFPTNWPATNFPSPRTLYIEGVATSATPRDLVWSLVYRTNLLVSSSTVVTDVLYTTVMDAAMDAYGPDKTTLLTNSLKRAPGMVISRNSVDADRDGKRDDDDARFNGPANTNGMALVVFRQMPGITNFAGLSNVFVTTSVFDSGKIRLFRFNPTNNEPCLVSNCGDPGILSFINIASQISTSDVRMLVEGKTPGTATISLKLGTLAGDSANVTILPIPSDSDADGICQSSGGSLNNPAVTSVDPVSFLPWTSVQLGRGSLPCGLSAAAYLTTWYLPAPTNDPTFLRQNFYSLDTRVLPSTGDGFTRVIRPNGRVVAFNATNGLPQMPDLGRTYCLLNAGGNYVLVFASGYKHYFDAASGTLLKIEDPNGAAFLTSNNNWPMVSARTNGASVASLSSPGYGTNDALKCVLAYDASNRIASVISDYTTVTFTNQNNTWAIKTATGTETNITALTPAANSIAINRSGLLTESWSLPLGTNVVTCIRNNTAKTDYALASDLLGDRITQVAPIGTNSGGYAALRTTYITQTNSTLPGFGQVQWIIAPDSGFTYLTYDVSNRVTSTLRSLGNARVERQFMATTPAPLSNTCHVTTFNYASLGSDANNPVDYNRPRTIASYYQGTPIGKEFHVYGVNFQETRVATNVTAIFTDDGNLKTIVNFDNSFPGFPQSSQDPCDNITTFNNAVDGNGVKVTASVPGDPAGEGTITYFDRHGWVTRMDRAANIISVGMLSSNAFDTLGRTLSTLYPDGRRDAFQYNAWGFCTLSSNREGVVATFACDALLRTTNTVANNVTTRFANFDPFGNPRTISTFGQGTETQTTTRVFDGAGRLLSETAPFTGITTYDTQLDVQMGSGSASGNLFVTTRGDHSVTNESYRDSTPAGSYGSATHPVTYQIGVTNGKLFTATAQFPTLWTTNSLVSPAAVSVSRTVATTLDAAGRQDASINADATKVVLTTDRNGRTTCRKDENGNRTFLVYDPAGRLSRTYTDMNSNTVCDAGDKWTRWVYAYTTYNSAPVFRTDTYCSDIGTNELLVGSVLARVDGQGVWSIDPFDKPTYAETSYDGATRTSKTTLPDGSVATVVSVSNLVKSVKGATVSASTTVQQDGFLRTAAIIDPRVGQTAIQYTPGTPTASNRVTVVSPESTTATVHDKYNQLVQLTLPDGVTEKRDYFTTGEPSRTTGGHDLPQSFDWLATGEQTALSTFRNFNAAPITPSPASSTSSIPGGATTVASWPITNNNAAIPSSGGFDGVSDVTRWEYNLLRGWPDAKVYSDNTRHTFGHAPNGWVMSYTSARQISATYGRDAAGQLRTKLYSDGTPGVTNTWNQRDLVIAVRDAAGLRTNVFDAGSRLVSTAVSGPSSNALAITYATNSDERASVALTLGNSNVLNIAYAFDNFGRLASISTKNQEPGTTNNLTFTYTWLTNATLLSAITFPNGVTNQFLYQTNADRVAAIRVWPRFVTPPVGSSASPMLEYDYQYDAVGRCVNYARPYESRRDQYTYDQAGHLVQAQRQVTGRWSTASWLFDTAGNRVAETNGITGVVATRPCNALNQIRSCAYDLDGNLIANGPWAYTWDAENRLTSVRSNALLIATYQYDSQNRRISKTVGTTTYRYIYDGWNLVAEVGTAVPSGPVTTNIYVWGADHTGSLDTDSGGVRGLLAIISGATVYYPVMNNHGDVMALFDATGTNIVARYERDPFGVLLSATGPAAGICPFGFQTKYCDPETGLVYFGYRYYSPTLGIFISRDPLQEEGGVNLYGYGKGCPLAVDELGLEIVPDGKGGFRSTYTEDLQARLKGHEFRIMNPFCRDFAVWAGLGFIPDAIGLTRANMPKFGEAARQKAKESMASSSPVEKSVGVVVWGTSYPLEGFGYVGSYGLLAPAAPVVDKVAQYQAGLWFLRGVLAYGTAKTGMNVADMISHGDELTIPDYCDVAMLGLGNYGVWKDSTAVRALEKVVAKWMGPAAQARAWQGQGFYPGVDAWSDTTLPKGKVVYQLAYPGESSFFSTAEAAATCGGDSLTLSQALQVRINPGRGLRPGVNIFLVVDDVAAATSITRANPQFGPGGFQQFFIPDKSKLLEVLGIPLKK